MSSVDCTSVSAPPTILLVFFIPHLQLPVYHHVKSTDNIVDNWLTQCIFYATTGCPKKKVLIECCSSHGTPIQSPETGKMIFMNTWSWIWADNSSCFMGATVIHNGVRTIKKRCLIAKAGHVVHREQAWHRTKVRLCSWLSRGVSEHPRFLLFGFV